MKAEKVLTRVRKLLNMTTENGCTEAEAAAAAGQAQKLMLRHSLEAIDLEVQDEDEEIQAWDDPLDEMRKSKKQHWRGQLAMVICRHNGCSVHWSQGYHNPRLKIVGRASDATATRYLYMFCVREIERLRRNYRGNGQVWIRNYRLGLIDSIGTSLREAREAARQEYATETGTALVVVDQALATIDNRAALAQQFAQAKFRLRSGSGGGGRQDDSARATGQRDGKKININGGGSKQIGSQTRRLK